MMATQELKATISEQQEQKEQKDVKDASKPGHNNPKEAAHFVKDITDLIDMFMEKINGYNRYAAEDTYQDFVFRLHKQMMELGHNYFKEASVDTVLDTIPDKRCKLRQLNTGNHQTPCQQAMIC